MDNEKLEKILYVVSDTITGQNGGWEFSVNGLPMLCITDQINNRMRIIAPVREIKDVSDDELKEAMAANFHSALDVKYAISNDLMWVAFIHPLKELSKDQVISAVSQVYNAYSTFGTTYSSTDLVFPDPQKQEKEEEEKKKLRRSKI
ncbi:MAG: hypothetical protein AAF632_17875 [Bacteroidota bacterium]